MNMKLGVGFLITLTYFSSVLSAPSTSTESLVVTSTEAKSTTKIPNNDENAIKIPKISSMNVETNVSNRFATTQITSKVKNSDEKAQEATFSVVLPESAYISGFIMEIDGIKYESHIKEKEEAKKTYDEAVSSGIAAGHVALNARDSNRFTVSVNIEPESKAIFYLTYEELLKRQNGQYEIVINLHPGQLVKELGVQVNINESRPLTSVKAPSLRTGNEVSKNDEKLDPKAQIEFIDKNTAKVNFKPDIERQKEFAKNLETKESDGLAGQFVVQYDVERDSQGGEILVSDGYFVHFFAPKDLKPLPKHVVFVLDTSGSMFGSRIAQLKQAMKSILDQLNKEDTFNIVEFNSVVRVWNIPKVEVQYQEGEDYYSPEPKNRTGQTLPGSFEVSEENMKQAKNVVDKLDANGGTNIYSALNIALKLLKETKEKDERQPIVMFLTDGEPTTGETNPETIVSKISKENSDEVPIFSLSFGEGADRSFLEKISLKNHAFARHIYEAADASLQLESFYKYISSPLLNKVDFKYTTDKVSKLTKTKFPILFDGSEIIVAGKYPIAEPDKPETSTIADIVQIPGFVPVVRCFAGPIEKEFIPKFENPIGSLEKHWAYVTLQQILDERDVADNKTELTKKALDLALKYSFVTPVTSLVVVKPNGTKSEADLEDASKSGPGGRFGVPQFAFAPGAGAGGFPGVGGAYAPLSLNSYAVPAMPVPYGGYPALSTPFFRPAPTMDLVPTSEISIDSSDGYNKLKTDFPWLNGIYNAENGTINVDQGQFILDTEATILDVPECPKTPSNSTGTCILLKECPQIHKLLTDANTYKEYFCPLHEFAGVCCPVKPDDLSKIQDFKKKAATASPNI